MGGTLPQLLFGGGGGSVAKWRHHGLQHARLLCPPLSPGVCSNLCPLSHWYHPTFSSCVTPFSSCLQSFPAAGSFPVRQVFASGCQRTGASALASVLPVNIQGWFPLGWTSLISLLSKGLSRVLLQTFVNKVMTLDFNTLSRFVIVFLSRSKCLLILWLQWFWRPPKWNLSVSTVYPSICHEVMGPDAMILVLLNVEF